MTGSAAISLALLVADARRSSSGKDDKSSRVLAPYLAAGRQYVRRILDWSKPMISRFSLGEGVVSYPFSSVFVGVVDGAFVVSDGSILIPGAPHGFVAHAGMEPTSFMDEKAGALAVRAWFDAGPPELRRVISKSGWLGRVELAQILEPPVVPVQLGVVDAEARWSGAAGRAPQVALHLPDGATLHVDAVRLAALQSVVGPFREVRVEPTVRRYRVGVVEGADRRIAAFTTTPDEELRPRHSED